MADSSRVSTSRLAGSASSASAAMRVPSNTLGRVRRRPIGLAFHASNAVGMENSERTPLVLAPELGCVRESAPSPSRGKCGDPSPIVSFSASELLLTNGSADARRVSLGWATMVAVDGRGKCLLLCSFDGVDSSAGVLSDMPALT